MLLLEPLGPLCGRAAADALTARIGLPLAGGPNAFALARLHGQGPPRIVPVAAIPDAFMECVQRITIAPPPWAGLPTDRPLVMGIVNVTPDSFSDGGDRFGTDQAIAAGRAMAASGADLIDVGGESTRPGSSRTDSEIEQARVLPVIRALAEAGLVVSVDTRNAATMRAALAAGARVVNDVSGFAFDPAAGELARTHGFPVVVMHMRGTPATMQSLTDYTDVAVDVTNELAARLAALQLAPGQAAVDPGIGFAKGPGQNETLLARLPILLNLTARVLVGASRKGFIGRIVQQSEPKLRGPGSVASAIAGLLGGASIVRVHDAAETAQAVRVWEAVRASG
jgi:dihydropteroate synthase